MARRLKNRVEKATQTQMAAVRIRVINDFDSQPRTGADDGFNTLFQPPPRDDSPGPQTDIPNCASMSSTSRMSQLRCSSVA